MGILSAITRLFSRAESSQEIFQENADRNPGDDTIERVRKQGINPMVRNSDWDYEVRADHIRPANCLARDCGR